MKKFKLIVIVSLFPLLVFSQGAELVPFVGYMFGGSINYVEGKLKIENGKAKFLEREVRIETRRLDKGSHWPI